MRSAAVLSLLALAACQSYYRDYREFPVRGLKFEQIWNACLGAANVKFELDPAQTERGLKHFTTRWRNDLRAFTKGRRRRAYFEVLPEDNGDFLVRYYVERQKYGDMSSPLRPKEADWESDGQDGASEQLLRYHLRLRLAEAAGRGYPGARKGAVRGR